MLGNFLTWLKLVHSDEEQRCMYIINQSHLTVFFIIFVLQGGPCSPVRVIAQVQWFMHQNGLEPSGGIEHLYKHNRLL